jgi:hypothetical protein
MDTYSGEIFKGIALCWQQLSGEKQSEEIMLTKDDLSKSLGLLLEALSDQGSTIRQMIQDEPSLRGLL